MNSTSHTPPDWTASLGRHAAYIDVLGYGSILTTPAYSREMDRANVLLQVWTPLVQIYSEVVDGRPWVQGTLFSDSLFLSAVGPVGLIAVVARVFTGAYYFYEHRGQEDNWMPWLRAGIGTGWVLDVRDPIAASRSPGGKTRFTNPTGPGVADAYYRAEKSGLGGMRILVTDQIEQEFRQTSQRIQHGDEEVALYVEWLRAVDWPIAGDGLRDVPWWRCDNNGRVPERILHAHEWQTKIVGSSPARARAHFDETLRLIRS